MEISVAREFYIFFSMIATGALEGVLFDLFRGMRKSFLKGRAAVNISDALFWIFASVIFAWVLLFLTDGELRGYMLLGLGIGLVLYFLLLTKLVLKTVTGIFTFFLKIFKLFFKILLTPTRFLYKILIEPFLVRLKVMFKLLKKRLAGIFCIKKSRKKNDKEKKQK